MTWIQVISNNNLTVAELQCARRKSKELTQRTESTLHRVSLPLYEMSHFYVRTLEFRVWTVIEADMWDKLYHICIPQAFDRGHT